MATGDWDEPSRKEVGTSMTLADSPGRRRGVLSSAARMRRPRVGRQKRGVGADGGNGGGDVAAAAAAGDESSDDGRMRARDSLELYRRHHLHQVRARSAEGAGGARRRRIRVGHLPEDDGIKVAPVAPAKDVYDYPESMKFDNTMDPPKPRVLIQKHPKRPPSRHTKDHSSKTKVDPAPVIAPPMYSAILCNRARQAAVKQKLKELTELLEAPDLPPLKMDSSHFEDLRGPLDTCSSSEMHHRRRRISFCLASDSGDAGDTEENKVPKRRIKPSPEMVASVNLRPLATKPCKVSKNIETTADAWHLTLTCTGQNKNQKTHFSPAVARHLGNVRRQAVAYQNKNSVGMLAETYMLKQKKRNESFDELSSIIERFSEVENVPKKTSKRFAAGGSAERVAKGSSRESRTSSSKKKSSRRQQRHHRKPSQEYLLRHEKATSITSAEFTSSKITESGESVISVKRFDACYRSAESSHHPVFPYHMIPMMAPHYQVKTKKERRDQEKRKGKQEVRKDTSEKEGKVKISKSHRGRHMNPVFVPPPHAFPNPWESHFAARAPGYYCDCWDCINRKMTCQCLNCDFARYPRKHYYKLCHGTEMSSQSSSSSVADPSSASSQSQQPGSRESISKSPVHPIHEPGGQSCVQDPVDTEQCPEECPRVVCAEVIHEECPLVAAEECPRVVSEECPPCLGVICGELGEVEEEPEEPVSFVKAQDRSLVAEIKQVSELAARAGAGSVACDEDPAITRSEIPETAEMYQIPGTRTDVVEAILETEAEIPAPLLVEEGSDIAVEDDSSSKDPRGSPETGSTPQSPLRTMAFALRHFPRSPDTLQTLFCALGVDLEAGQQKEMFDQVFGDKIRFWSSSCPRKHAFAEEKFPGAHQEPAVDYIHAVTDHSLQSDAPVTAENTDTRTIMKRGDLIVDTRDTGRYFYVTAYCRGTGGKLIKSDIVADRETRAIRVDSNVKSRA